MTGAFARAERPVALVTGASRGLGLEVARLLARRGFGLILTARGAEALDAAAAELVRETAVVALAEVFAVNVLASLHLTQLSLAAPRPGDLVVVNVTSDAGVQAYPGWGGYGASKAALEHLSRTLAAELADRPVRVYVVDPGDMNTVTHQLAEPGVDLSGLPDPTISAPAIVRMIVDETAPFRRVEAQAELAAV